jgi:cell division protein FtsL
MKQAEHYDFDDIAYWETAYNEYGKKTEVDDVEDAEQAVDTERERKRARRQKLENQRRQFLDRLVKATIVALIIVVIAIMAIRTITFSVNANLLKAQTINQLEEEINTLSMENDVLRIQVDQLSSVSRIESMALDMGMEKPTSKVYVPSSLIEATVPLESEPEAPKEEPVEQSGTFSLFWDSFGGFFAFAGG